MVKEIINEIYEEFEMKIKNEKDEKNKEEEEKNDEEFIRWIIAKNGISNNLLNFCKNN